MNDAQKFVWLVCQNLFTFMKLDSNQKETKNVLEYKKYAFENPC